MPDVRELLARLNPQTARFDIGYGGIPSLTNQDIAGGLGMVPPGLGRELLEACWWPDGARLRRHKLRDAIVGLVLPELAKQAKRLSNAELDVSVINAAIAFGGRGATSEQMRSLANAQLKVDRLRQQSWPRKTVQMLPEIASAVIGEIVSANRCDQCRGTGTQVIDGQDRSCPECKGAGIEPQPDRRRASILGIDHRNFVRDWKPLYEWMVVKFRDAEQSAASQLHKVLRRDEEAA